MNALVNTTPVAGVLYRKADRLRRSIWRSNNIALLLFTAASLVSLTSLQTSSHLNLSLIVASATLMVAIILQTIMSGDRYYERWKRLLNAGDRIQSLAWCYAIGCHPFPIDTISVEPEDQRLESAVFEVLDDIRDLVRYKQFENLRGQFITPTMTQLRHSSLSVRKQTYIDRRIEMNLKYDRHLANSSRRQTVYWNSAAFVLQFLSIAGLICGAFGLLPTATYGVIGTFGASVVSYTQGRQFHRNREDALESIKRLEVAANAVSKLSDKEWAVRASEIEGEVNGLRRVRRPL